ncbi:non-specific serine,threonine protein kinase [Sarracenia purpurea var. burkii]
MVARELSKLLNMRSEDVTSFVTGEVGLDMDVVSSLVTSLLSGCVEESTTSVGQRLKLLCADCLGALGAVDPGASKVGTGTLVAPSLLSRRGVELHVVTPEGRFGSRCVRSGCRPRGAVWSLDFVTWLVVGRDPRLASKKLTESMP